MCSLNTHTLTHTHKHTHGANAVLVWSGEDPAHWPHLGSEPAQMPQWETTTDSQKEGGTQVIHDWINCRDSRSDGDILDDFCLTNGLTGTLFFHNLLKLLRKYQSTAWKTTTALKYPVHPYKLSQFLLNILFLFANQSYSFISKHHLF